jgi:uncharacterized protein YacL
MNWNGVARIVFAGAVAYCAFLLRPLGGGVWINLGFAFVISAGFIYLEQRLRETSLANVIGALVGGAAGLFAARTIGSALFWANTGDARVAFLHSLVLLVLPYIGLVLGGKAGEWLEPDRMRGIFRAQAPQRRYRILDTSVIIDGRIVDICGETVAAEAWTFFSGSRKWPVSTSSFPTPTFPI